MGTIDSGTGKLRVQLPASGTNSSFAMADGGSISSYSWGLPSGCSLVSGYVQTDDVVQIDCDPGFYWISLTVVDSNAQSHVARVWVYARDPEDDTTTEYFGFEQSIRPQGQTATVRLWDDFPGPSEVAVLAPPPGTLVAVMDGEMSGPTDRSNLRFWGWHDTDPRTAQATRTGLLRETTLECVDVAGRLDRLPGFGVSVLSDTFRNTTDAPTINWHHMVNPTLDKYIHYLLHWYSTALEVADWTSSGTGTTYATAKLVSFGKSLWAQAAEVADKLGGYHALTCNRYGQMGVTVEPLHRSFAFRPSTVTATIDEDAWSELRYTGQRGPRLHWLRGAGVIADDDPEVDEDGRPVFATVFCVAPGDAYGQGEAEEELNELLVLSQDALNNTIGERYARRNAPYGWVSVRLADGDDRAIDPAAPAWVWLTATEATRPQLGTLWNSQRGS
jgi:hypothetical protein